MSAPAASTIRAASAIAARLGAEDLDRQRMLVGRDAQVAERALVPVLDPGRRDHLRADETGAEPSSLPPKGLDADAGHRCEHDPRRHLDPADRPRLQEVYRHPAMVSVARLTRVDRGGTIRPRRRPFAAGRFMFWGPGGLTLKEVILTPDGLQEAPGRDRGAVDRTAARGRGADPHRARVRRHRRERRVRLGEERPGPSRGAHRDARGAAQERARRHEEGDPLGRGQRRDEGPAQGHGLEQDGRVPHRRLGGGRIRRR